MQPAVARFRRGPRRALATLTAFVLLLACGLGAAQSALIINGVNVPGVTTTLLAGSSYAPADALASAIGAELAIDLQEGLAVLTLGGRVVRIRSYATPQQAAAATDAVQSNGAAPSGPGAIEQDGRLMLPVKAIISAFGGTVAYLAEQNRVAAVLPRARLLGATSTRTTEGDRITVDLSANVPYSTFFNAPLNTLMVRFERTDTARAVSLDGSSLRRADIIPGAGYSDLRLILEPGFEATLFTSPAGNGFQLVIDTRPDTEPQNTARPSGIRIVIDPGHGGEDAGLVFSGYGSESTLTLAFAQQLQQALARRGVDAELTRNGNDRLTLTQRSSRGVAADLFLSIHAADLPPGSLRSYYLDDAADPLALELAASLNNETTGGPGTQGVRRDLLLELLPDLERGRRYANALASELFDAGGYRTATPTGAPLVVLRGAAGRGLLLEINPVDLSDPQLAEMLAATITTILASDGLR